MDNKKRKLILIIIVVVAIFSLSFGTYLMFFDKNNTINDGLKENEKKTTNKSNEKKESSTDENKSNNSEVNDNTTSEKTVISSDSDLPNVYEKIDNLSKVETYAEKVANLYVYCTQFNFSTGSISVMDSTDVINMVILLLPMNNSYVNTCYKQDYINEKVNELFNIKYDNTISWKSGTIENNCYCTDYNFGAGGNTNPLQLLSKNKYESDGSVLVDVLYGYEESTTTITVEFKLIDGRYVINSISKK